MDWSIAGYGSHPIDGEASQIEACATHLGTVASDIREQITRLRGINSSEIWESSQGSAEAFQEVVEDLPDKLELVATRYERVSEALAGFHPTLASTKEDAEYWIQQAETAQAEVERTEAGKEEMEDFEDNAEDGQEWEGEDYGASSEAAEGDLQTAIDNVHNAVSAFESAAESAEEDINNASDDDLKNESGFFGLSISWDDVLDVLEVVVDVLNVVVGILSIIALFVPGLNLIVLALAAVVLIGTIILAANGRKDGWDVAFAAIGFVAAGVAAFSSGAANVMRGGRFLQVGRWGQGNQAVNPVITNFIHGERLIVNTVSNPAYVSVARLAFAENVAGVTGIAFDNISKFRRDGEWSFEHFGEWVQNPAPSLTEMTGINIGDLWSPVPNLASAALD